MRILIIKIGDIGDVAMTLPLIEHIYASHTGARITYLVGNMARPLLDFSCIEEIITVDERGLKGGFFSRSFFVLSVWRRLFRRSFDRVLILYRDRRYRILTWSCRCGQIDQLTRRGANLDVAQINEMIALFSQSQEAIKWPVVEKRCDKERILLALGGESKQRNHMHLRSWSAKNYAQLAKKLIEKGYRVTVTGRQEELIHSHLFKDPQIDNLIGKTSLKELTHLIASARAVVTHDGGSLHLAQMSKTPTLALFGPTDPREFVVAPSVKVMWQGEKLECSPCYNGSECGPCIHNSCMKLLTPEDVCAALLSMIG